MRSISPLEVVALWERGRGRSRLRQAVLLLAWWLGQPVEDVLQLTVGRRDLALFHFRAAVFGPELIGLTACPACHQRVEVRWNTEALATMPAAAGPEPLAATQGDYEARFRLPTSLDLEELSADLDLETNRRRLVERCLLEVRREEPAASARPGPGLPGDLVRAIGDRMAEADPLADLQWDLQCPECAHRWEVPLDIGSFLASELNAWAERLLTEVHRLASAYGWSEAEILSLSSARREFYLRLLSE